VFIICVDLDTSIKSYIMYNYIDPLTPTGAETLSIETFWGHVKTKK